ncbi:unnamed protein product [Onchocerca flexuosa]|uniref:DUF4094 domain-containing protein n=1 Tax=Onchocerca flexuosa TaxID=387005 RepID=A0A183I2N8_9BILA|nr:unnamed protein product [Onchocerca flexuosa]
MTTLLVPTSLAAQIQNIRLPSRTNVRNELNSVGCPSVCQLAYRRCFSSLSASLFQVLLRDIQKRGFRTQRAQKVNKPKKGFFAILGINTLEYLAVIIINNTKEEEGIDTLEFLESERMSSGQNVRQKGPQTKAFREKLKTVSDNDRKGFLEGYMAALDYSNEQKQKRSVVRTILLSATIVGLGLCKF